MPSRYSAVSRAVPALTTPFKTTQSQLIMPMLRTHHSQSSQMDMRYTLAIMSITFFYSICIISKCTVSKITTAINYVCF